MKKAAKEKKVKENKEVKKEKEKELPTNVCENCFKATGKKITMTERDKESLECPKCHGWKAKPKIGETKEEKVARLKKELEEAEKD